MVRYSIQFMREQCPHTQVKNYILHLPPFNFAPHSQLESLMVLFSGYQRFALQQ